MSQLSLILVWGLSLVLGILVLASPGKSFKESMGIALRQSVRVIPTVVPAIIAAGFLGALLPNELIGAWVGRDSGLVGMLIAAAMGTVIPTGPMVVLPIAAALLNAGGGIGQICAMIGAWSIINLHRTFIFEIPFLGMPLAIRRLATGLVITPLTGLSAQALVWLLGW